MGVSAAYDALFALYATAAATGSGTTIEGVQVVYGPPTEYEEQEVVALLGLANADEVTAGMAIDEGDFTIIVRVKVHNPAGDSAQAVSQRGWVVVDKLEDLVEATPLLSGAVAKARPAGVASIGVQRVSDAPGWVIYIDVLVNCRVFD